MSSTFTSLLEKIEAELAKLDVKALLFYSVSACGLAVALGLWAALLYPPAEIWTREKVDAQTTMLQPRWLRWWGWRCCTDIAGT